MKRVILSVACLAVCLEASLLAQQARPAITIKPVAGPIYILQGGGGNIGVMTDAAGLFMVDAMMESSAEGVRAAIKSLPGGDHVRILVNTHWHFDHVGGNKAVASGALIISHEHVWPLLAHDQTVMGNTVKAFPAEGQPNLTYGDHMTIYVGGEAIRLVHFPHSHTDGDTAVFFDKQNVVHLGDLFFNGMFPFLDVDNGGDIDNWVRELDIILAALPPDVKIIPGHGPLAGVAELKAFRQMLTDSSEFVRGQMKSGKSLEQIKASALPASLAPWAKGFLKPPQWLEMVHRSLTKNK
jgi:cyclase